MNKLYISLLILMIVFVSSQAYSRQIESDSNSDWINLNELMDMKIVTAGKQEQLAKEVPASIVVITRESIKKYGYRSLSEILQSISGLYLIEQYNWTGMTGFGIRGYFAEGSFSNMVVMINGNTALKEGYINQYIIARLGVSVEAIDRIEVVRGPMSVMYGNGAFFGAINIITNDKNEVTESLVSASYGSNNCRTAAIHIDAKEGDLALHVNIGLITTSGIDKPYTSMTSNPIVRDAEGNEKTYLESIGLSNDATTANHLGENINNFSLSTSYKDFSFDVSTTRAELGLLWTAPSIKSKGQRVLINGSDARFKYKLKVSDNLQFNALMSYGMYNSVSRYSILATDTAGQSVINSTNIIAEVNSFYTPLQNLEITSGLVVERMENASNDVDIPKFNVANSSWRISLEDYLQNYEFYTQFVFKPIENLSLIAGIRSIKYGDYDYQRIINEGLPNSRIFEETFSEKRVQFTNRLAAVYQINKNNVLKIMYGTALQSPNMRQNVTRIDLNGKERSQLKPSEIETFEVSYSNNFGDALFSTISLFRNDLNRIIESSGFLDADSTYSVITQNTGKIKTYGAEVSLLYKMFDKFELQLCATYQHSKNMKKGWEDIEIAYSPELLAYSKASFHITEDLTISAFANYVDDMLPSWNQTDIDPSKGERYGKKINDYLLLNTNVLYNNLFLSGLNVSLYLSNILDSDIRFPTDPSNQWADKGFVGVGFGVNLKLTYIIE